MTRDKKTQIIKKWVNKITCWKDRATPDLVQELLEGAVNEAIADLVAENAKLQLDLAEMTVMKNSLELLREFTEAQRKTNAEHTDSASDLLKENECLRTQLQKTEIDRNNLRHAISGIHGDAGQALHDHYHPEDANIEVGND